MATTNWYTITSLNNASSGTFNSKNGYKGNGSSNWYWGKYSGGARGGYFGRGKVNSNIGEQHAVLVFWVPFPTVAVGSTKKVTKIEVQMYQNKCSGINSGRELRAYACKGGPSGNNDTPANWLNGTGGVTGVFDSDYLVKTGDYTSTPATYTFENASGFTANTSGCFICFSGNDNYQNLTEFDMGNKQTRYPRFRFTYTDSSSTPTNYTITYYRNFSTSDNTTESGGTVASGTYYILEDCHWTRQGYSFNGWVASRSSSSIYDPGASVKASSNQTWYATWVQNEYTVNFYPGDHATVSNIPANAIPRTYTEGGSLKLLSSTAFTGQPDYTYYTTNYYLQGGDVTSYNYPSSSSRYTRSGSSSNYCYSVEDDKETDYSYEYWRGSDDKLRKCGDTYNNLSGDMNMWPYWSGTVNYNAQFNPPNATRTGYRLSGWATSPTGTPNYQSGTNYQQSSNQNLYAIWEADQVYINYYTDNDTAQPTDTVVQGPYDVGDRVKLSDGSGWISSKWGSSVTFYTNYNFQGGSFSNGVTPNSTYSVSRTGKYDWVISGWLRGSQRYELSDWITLNSNISIYPYWADSSSIVSHAAFTPITPIRKGYKFLNWNTQANGSGTAYYVNTNYNTSAIDKDLTLYAIWEPEWTIKINNGTSWGDYHVWIYTGTTSNNGWQQAIPYVYDGSNWKLTKI